MELFCNLPIIRKTNVKIFDFFRMEKGMKRVGGKKEPNLNIFQVYILVIVISDLIFYPLFPILLNYPPGSINSQFDIEFSKISYFQQYLIINLLIVTFGYIFFKLAFKGIDKWSYIVKSMETNNIRQVKKIRKKSFTVPHLVYLLQILIPLVFVGVLFIILGFRNIADIKLFLILTVGLTLTGQISYLLSKKYFREVLKYTYLDDIEVSTVRIGLRQKIILQILPLFLFSILFILLIGHSGLVKEKGNILFKNYQQRLKTVFKNVSYIKNEEQIKELLSLVTLDNENDITFYLTPVGNYKTSDNSRLSNFFLKYTKELAFKYNGHTYDYYGSDIQGVVLKLRGINGDWIFGIRYVVTSPETVIMFVISYMILAIFAVFILLYFGKVLAEDITLLASGLKEIAEGAEIDLSRKIAITSRDEIGDLVLAFNKVQEREKDYIQEIKEQQRIIIQQERLASLGQIIGGIMHNLKTPMLSLFVAIRSLKDLVEEYQASIGDLRVSNEDHYEIATEMQSWLIEMEPYCEYMNDVLATIKGQIVQRETSLTTWFTLKELVKRVEIITHHELIKSKCDIRYEIRADLDLKIMGQISDLVQVLENLISNSIQAFQKKGGLIEITIDSNGASLEFKIKDTGRGIPENIKTKLFKKMVSTKGKNGTGLGLYISSAIIKGKFGGDIWFDSIAEQGTTFYISIPLNVNS